jgi:hypothetical protein
MRSSVTDELLTFLFDGQPHLLAAPMETWLESSRRYAAFVNDFRDKIRKKLRVTQERESLLDLRLELETAYLLLNERSFSLVYEPTPGGRTRGPDFAVTFTTSMTFMVEVTRLRGDEGNFSGEDLADTICSKLGQMQPQQSNVMVVGIEAAGLTQESLRTIMLNLQQRAERNDPAVVQRHGFRERADFFRHYQRLSEMLVRRPNLAPDPSVISWVNPQAKYPLPSKVRTVLYRSHNESVL